MSLINITGLTFAYDGSYENIFEDVSFQLDTDWRLGFTGRNGRGKTTFLKILKGELEYKGKISVSNNVARMGFDYFPFPVEDPYQSTIDIVNQINPNYEHWELLRELSILQVEDEVLYRPFNTLSNGEQTKILLAVLFLKESSFLLIDEPTNHLDAKARVLVSDYLKSKKGFILVSHDRAFLDNCIDHILSINKANIEIQKGNFSSWWFNKERRDQFEIAENERLKKDIKRLEVSARRSADWSDKLEKTKHGTRTGGLRPDRGYIGHKSAKMMKRAKSTEQRQTSAIEEKSKLLKNLEEADNLKLYPQIYHANKLVSLENVSIRFAANRCKEKVVCDQVGFSIEQGDRIALQGKNGSGKTSLLKLIKGENIDYQGHLIRGSNLSISYVSQDTSFLKGNLSDFVSMNQIEESLLKAILRKLDFSRIQFEKEIQCFSEGQKKKVLIAKSLCEKAHLYLWDEPLNFIDVFSRMQIEELLLAYKPTILFVEHDSIFSKKIATKIVTL